METTQVVSITFFRYQGLRDFWWAFQQMGRGPGLLKGIPGLLFAKMLGSGGDRGFSIFPNFGVYGLLCVWESEGLAQVFFSEHTLMDDFRGRCHEHWTVFMKTAKTHGYWDGVQPFTENAVYNADLPVGVITRATIRTRQLWRFWRFVPPVSKSINDKEGLLFAVGIGELPLVQQATFSLWQNSHFMKAYAYQSAHHREVVKKTRELGWYKEELFARFHPYRTEGSWEGQDPLATYLETTKNVHGA